MYSDSYGEEGNVRNNQNNDKMVFIQNNKSKIIICAVLLIAIIILIFVVFKGKGGGSYTIKISPEGDVTVSPGSSYNLSATVSDSKGNALNTILNWISNNNEIATVENGTVKGVSYGRTTVVASYVGDNGKSVRSEKNVIVADGVPGVNVTNVSLPDGELVLPLNEDYNIKLDVSPSNGYIENVEYTSSNQNVVIVDKSGKVTSLGEGTATITIKVNNGAFTKELKVVVDSDAKDSGIVDYPTNISFDPSVNKVAVGGTASLVVITTPANARTDQLTWSSSDSSILTVDNKGVVTGVAPGTATVTASSINNVAGKIDVTVEAGEIQKIEFSPMEVSFDVNNNAILTLITNTPVMLTPIVTPTNPTNPMLTFTPANPAILSATVDTTGTMATLTGLSAGTTELVVKSTNNIEAKVQVTVVNSGGSSGSCASCKNKTCDAGKYCYCGSCRTCPEGSYCVDGVKKACPAGEGSKEGASSCTKCTGNNYSKNGVCTACPTGQKANDFHTGCFTATCSAGYYTATINSTDCLKCPKGYKCNGSYKTACDGNTYSSYEGASTCSTCPSGKVANENHTGCVDKTVATDLCEAGRYYDTSSKKCVLCPANAYCVNSVKYNCPSGTHTTMQGAGSRNACVPY